MPHLATKGPPCTLGSELFFSAATQKAFTTVLAGFAFTITTLPKTSRFPAFVAGFCLVFTMHTPGMVNFPAFFNSDAATPCKLSNTATTSFRFISAPSAIVCASAVLVMGLPPAFMLFIAAGAMAGC